MEKVANRHCLHVQNNKVDLAMVGTLGNVGLGISRTRFELNEAESVAVCSHLMRPLALAPEAYDIAVVRRVSVP